jgi:5-methylcytosine-specific restriction enzyme subunit McrC
MERLLRQELMRDYDELADQLPAIRGRLELLPTASLYYAGRLAVACEFDEFAFDTPLNRILKAAAASVAGSRLLEAGLRQRAIRILARLDDVGPMRPSDLAATVDRRTGHYRDSVLLARQVLHAIGRQVRAGTDAAWTFLIRTPDLVEAGVRAVLADGLAPTRVTKETRHATGSTLSFNPDLVFDHGRAVGDVKYKVSGSDWGRGDLYQAIAFAEAFGAMDAVVVGFGATTDHELVDVDVGQKAIRALRWTVDVDPELASRRLVADVQDWLLAIPRRAAVA